MHKKKYLTPLLFLVWSTLNVASFGGAIRPGYAIANILAVLALTGISTVIAQAFVLVLSLLSLILFPVTANFGTHVLNMVVAVRYTNTQEVLEAIRSLPALGCTMGILSLGVGIMLCRRLTGVKSVLTAKQSAVSFIIFALIILYKPVFGKGHEPLINKFGYQPVKIWADVKDALEQIKQDEALLKKANARSTTFSPRTVGNHYDTYIMVIGESVRRDHMNEYGFPIQDTPFLSSVNGMFFDNWVSAGPSTVPSLTNSLLKNHEYNNSVIHLAQKAGFFTYWLSNQGTIGAADSPVSAIGKQADYSLFLKQGDYADNYALPDSELIPEVTKALSRPGKKLIIVHLIGSHPDFCARTNNHYDDWYVNRKLSCYIQSIKNTDKLLNAFYSLALRSGSKWSMLYFADHGLAHNGEQNLVHHDRYLQNYAPPFMLTSYDSDKKVHIQAARSGFDFMKIFSQWLEINEPSLHSDIDWFSEQPTGEEPRVIAGNGERVLLSTRKNDPVLPVDE
ncbi:TPA: phosphoethanolamine transferase [Escherichia coli]|nr:phosphoethanolamine transferase [Escherichia coli]